MGGGLIIIFATFNSGFVVTKLDNIYIILLIVTTLWMGTINFVDDYIKIFKKRQTRFGCWTSLVKSIGFNCRFCFSRHPGVTVREDSNTTFTYKNSTKRTTVSLLFVNKIDRNDHSVFLKKITNSGLCRNFSLTGDDTKNVLVNFYSNRNFYHSSFKWSQSN
jgi:hypothetical protein